MPRRQHTRAQHARTQRTEASRAILVWIPDWPIVAARQACRVGSDVEGEEGSPIAIIDRGLVFACSARARADGVRRGLRLREAQSRCTELVTLAADPVLDVRAFEPVLAGIEQLMPGVQPIRPGICAVRARGPARFYGSEAQAAAMLLRCLGELGFAESRIGVADGLFAAEQAARYSTRSSTPTGDSPVRIVPPGESPRFLAPLPVGILGDAPLATVLIRLGVHTLGNFAALDAAQVRHRFGESGARAHALAGGTDASAVTPRPPRKNLDVTVEFEPPLERIDQVTFTIRSAADQFITQLNGIFQVCTSIQVTVHSESGEVSERTWLHPRWFTAADVVDRVRWQLQGSGTTNSGLNSAVARVTVSPGRLDAVGNHEEGLWGTAPDERIHHGLSRVQGILGHDEVFTPMLGGGRMLAERQILVPWGDRPPEKQSSARGQPWPGNLPAPLPASVFSPPLPAVVLDRAGIPVAVDDRGGLTASPDRFTVADRFPTDHFATDQAHPDPLRHPRQTVAAWAGPWPIEERWWDADSARTVNRFQMVDADGAAWLLLYSNGQWWAEARYD
ncbi:MAG: DNA polymerase Y family protein [Microbacteriaceae bacterium]